jgi:general secretion pathway protein D
MRKPIIYIVSLSLTFPFLNSCASRPTREPVSDLSLKEITATIEKKITVTTPDVKNGMQAFIAADYIEASRFFSRALKFDPKNASLHFLNALCYHMLAENGDTSQIELAEIGYNMSMEFDPSNPWPARFLGNLRMSQKKYSEARDLFARALQVDKNSSELLLSLARAAYYAQDLKTANAAITQAEKTDSENPQVISAAAMIYAAAGNFNESEKALKKLSQSSKNDPSRVEYLNTRLQDWRSAYKNAGIRTVAQNDDRELPDDESTKPGAVVPPQFKNPSTPSKSNVGPASVDASEKVPRMVTIDVVLIRSDEITRTNKGVNLLNGLQLQFSGSSITGANQINVLDPDTNTNAVNTTSRALTNSISVPAVNYNLNIFNDNDARHEVLARPTLISMEGKPSTFFSGATLNVAVDGNSGSSGSIQPIPIGVNLSVTPQFIDDETIKLEVDAGREFVEEPNVNASFSKFVQTSKNKVNVNVVMKFEETLIVSGMSEKATSIVRDGVPFLKSIPFIQYFFSNEKTLDFNRSVLILMTPHRPRLLSKNSGSNGVESQEIKNLKKKVDWFSPASTTDLVLTKLGSNEYYTEFRSGDIESSAWNHNSSMKSSINRALSFLYY